MDHNSQVPTCVSHWMWLSTHKYTSNESAIELVGYVRKQWYVKALQLSSLSILSSKVASVVRTDGACKVSSLVFSNN